MNNGQTAIRERLQRKIDLLRQWAIVGVPADRKSDLPTSITKFATWVDHDLGLKAIRSPNAVSSNGPHRDLITQASDLIRALRVPRRTTASQSDQTARREAKLADSEDRVRELTGAWHMARELATQLEVECVSYRSRIADLEAENAQLRKKLDHIVPLRKSAAKF